MTYLSKHRPKPEVGDLFWGPTLDEFHDDLIIGLQAMDNSNVCHHELEIGERRCRHRLLSRLANQTAVCPVDSQSTKEWMSYITSAIAFHKFQLKRVYNLYEKFIVNKETILTKCVKWKENRYSKQKKNIIDRDICIGCGSVGPPLSMRPSAAPTGRWSLSQQTHL